MRNFLRPFLIGLAGFLLGAACLFAFLKFSPSSSQELLAASEPKQHKPIPSAINLPARQDDEEEQAQGAPPVGGAPGANAPPMPNVFDKDDEDFFNGQDPFTAMRKMQEEVRKQMQRGFAGFDAEESGGQITEKEDAKSLSYEISGVEGSSLNTKVQNGYLTISGNAKKEQAGMSFTASFQRSFPLPRNVDPSKMETISEKDRVVLRFPKRGA